MTNSARPPTNFLALLKFPRYARNDSSRKKGGGEKTSRFARSAHNFTHRPQFISGEKKLT